MSLRPGATLDQKIARKSVLKMIAYGVAITESVNLMTGHETDRNPLKRGPDGKWHSNPNFYTMRILDRDRSIFGPWASLVALITNVGTGHPDKALRGLAGGILANAWDFVEGKDFKGDTAYRGASNSAKRLLSNFIPFTADEIPFLAKQASEGPEGAFSAAANALGEFGGFKSSPLTYNEQLDEYSMRTHGQHFKDISDQQRDDIKDRSEFKAIAAENEARRAGVPENYEIQQAFKTMDDTTDKVGERLAGELDANRNGGDLRKSIKAGLTEIRNVSNAVFTDRVEAGITGSQSDRQLMRTVYKSAQPHEDLTTGALDFDIPAEGETKSYNQIQAEVLAAAKAAGVPEDFITGRSRQFEDTHVQAAVDAYREMQQTLKEYWEIENIIPVLEDPDMKALWVDYKAMTAVEKRIFELETPNLSRIFKGVVKQTSKLRIGLRATDPAIEAALVDWYDLTPLELRR